ncbi:MAG: hypothetical protein GC145_14430 [Caulobacter sp.]|nr:hypothetical protein [Caulobacter sp.]
MTSQVVAELPFYRQDGSFLGYAGFAATLVLALTQPQESGPPVPQNLDGRLFEQRVLTSDGQVLLSVLGVNRTGGRVAFPMTAADSLVILPPAGVVALDLVHVVGEVTLEGLSPLINAPFAMRRSKPGSGATVLKLDPIEGVVMVRYEGAPPLTLLQELIAGGSLAADASYADMVQFLQHGLSDDQAAALAAVQAQQAASIIAVNDAAEAAASDGVQAVATREGQALVYIDELTEAAVEAVAVRQGQALTAVAARETQAIANGGPIDLREDVAIAAVATREGQAITAVAAREAQAVANGGPIDQREDVAIAAVATREGQAITAVAARETQAITGGGPIDLREDQAVALVAATEAGVLASVAAAGVTQLGIVNAAGPAQVGVVNAAGVIQVANVTAAAGAQFKPDTATGLADVAEGGYFHVVVAGDAVLYRDVAGVAVEQFRWKPGSYFEVSTKVLPTGYADAFVDSYDQLGPRVLTDGTLETPALTLTPGGSFVGIPAESVEAVLQAGLASLSYRGPVWPTAKLTCYASDGQSDSEGADSMNAISTAPLDGLLMFEAVRLRFVDPLVRFTGALQPMVEANYSSGGVNWGESPVYQTGATVLDRLDKENRMTPAKAGFQLLGWSTGVSSTGIVANNRGGSNGSWTMLEAACDAAVAKAAAKGWSVEFAADTWQQAATDYDLGTTKAAYYGYLLQRLNDLQTYIKPKFPGQTRPIHMIIIQDHHHPSRGSVNDPKLAEAQLQLAQAYPDLVHIAGPQYAMLYEVGGSHHSNRESAITGAWRGICLKRVWFDREAWDNFAPLSVVAVTSTTIEIAYADLANTQIYWDCKEIGLTVASVGAQPRYGFDVLDNVGGSLTLVGLPWIVGRNKVRIKLAAPLTNSGETVQYARGTYGGNLKRKGINALFDIRKTINAVSEPIEQWACVTPRIPIVQ